MDRRLKTVRYDTPVGVVSITRTADGVIKDISVKAIKIPSLTANSIVKAISSETDPVFSDWLSTFVSAVAGSYLLLSDTPDSYAGKAKNIPIVTDAENGMDFMGTVLAKLTHLADFPAAYTGQSLKLVRVKADESGVEFITNNLLPDTVKQEIELNAAWKLGSNLYVENVFTGSDLTQVNYWSTSAKTLKLFTKDITYTGGNPTTIVLKDEVTGKLLTTTIAYTGSDVLNITKVVS